MTQQSPDEDLLETFLKVFQSNLGQALDSIPWYLSRIIEEKAWTAKTSTAGTPYGSFEQWVTDRGWWGLRTTVEHLLTLCESRPDVQALIRAEVASTPMPAHGEIGNGRSRDSVSTSTGRGSTYLLKRLKRDHPEIAEKVVSGELSAHAGAVTAGITKPTWTAPDDPERLAARVSQRYPGWAMVRVSSGQPEEAA